MKSITEGSLSMTSCMYIYITNYTTPASHPGVILVDKRKRQKYHWYQMVKQVNSALSSYPSGAMQGMRNNFEERLLTSFPAFGPLQYLKMYNLGPLPKTISDNQHVLIYAENYKRLKWEIQAKLQHRGIPLTYSATTGSYRTELQHIKWLAPDRSEYQNLLPLWKYIASLTLWQRPHVFQLQRGKYGNSTAALEPALDVTLLTTDQLRTVHPTIGWCRLGKLGQGDECNTVLYFSLLSAIGLYINKSDHHGHEWRDENAATIVFSHSVPLKVNRTFQASERRNLEYKAL